MSAKTTTCNLDPIPTHILKQCSDILVKPIKTIINKSFSEAKFPTEWKCATVVPLLKKNNLERTFKNYRPVSNLSFTSKLLEKAALNQLIPHLESTKSYAVNNSAYKKFYSTDTFLTEIHSDILENMDQQKLSYLKNLLNIYRPTRTLRSLSQSLLKKTVIYTSTGRRSFKNSGPEIWKSLPLNIRKSETFTSFGKKLKTYLFSIAYNA